MENKLKRVDKIIESTIIHDKETMKGNSKLANKQFKSPTDAETLVDWADEVGLPARSMETHPNRPYGKEPHIHVGSVDHIPVKVSQE